MAAAWRLFQRELTNILNSKKSQNSKDFADKFSDAYSRSILNLATTSTGQLMLSGNFNLIKTSIKTFLDFNRNIEKHKQNIETSIRNIRTSIAENLENVESIPNEIVLPSDIHSMVKQILQPSVNALNKKLNSIEEGSAEQLESIIGEIKKFETFVNGINLDMVPYIFLESAFLSFWLTSKFSSVPPVPPTIAPLFGTIVISPGIPGILSASFKLAFTSKDASKAAEIISKGFETHSKTISGTYSGLIPSPTGPIPSPPVPWFGII